MIAGRQALPPGKFDRLLDILGFQVRHEYYEPSKACILIAEMGKHAREACHPRLDARRDWALSIDAVPDRGGPDPSLAVPDVCRPWKPAERLLWSREVTGSVRRCLTTS